MGELRQWLQRQRTQIVHLFATDDRLVVETHAVRGLRLLKRHPQMESAVIAEVEAGIARTNWHGLIYLMGWGDDLKQFVPLYIGKAGRKGVKHPLSVNLQNLSRDKGKFARWGDGNAYHIGDLSQVLFRWKAYKAPSEKYERWAEMLFLERDPPTLRQRTSLVLVPWFDASTTPSGNRATIEEAEAQLISLALDEYEDTVLNVEGETWRAPASSSRARPPATYKPRRRVLLIERPEDLRALCDQIAREKAIGLDVETELRTQRLCLAQVASSLQTAIIDVLQVGDLSPLKDILEASELLKIIHNAPFERRVFSELGIAIRPVFDTLAESRRRFGKKAPEGHGLAAVCRRLLGITLDKSEQHLHWAQRPLTDKQLNYAAADAEVLLELYNVLRGKGQSSLF